MTVLSDRDYIRLSTPPTNAAPGRGGSLVYLWEAAGDCNNLPESLYRETLLTLEERELYAINHPPMFEPFIESSIKRAEDGAKIASYGVSSFGYDIRAAPEFKIFIMPKEGDDPVDFKNITDDMFDTVFTDKVIIPGNSFILARSVEYVRVPSDTLMLCIGKSTLARVGINCLCTPLEPGWEGHITLEFQNTLPRPNTFYANEGCLQLVGIRNPEGCLTTYKDRDGKYMGQPGEIVLPRV